MKLRSQSSPHNPLFLFCLQRPYFQSCWVRARSQLGTNFSVVFPYTLYPAGNELVPSTTKNTASGCSVGSLLSWIPRKRKQQAIYGSLRCISSDKKLKSICITSPQGTAGRSGCLLYNKYYIMTFLQPFFSARLFQ